MSSLNPLNDLSKIYLDTVAKAHKAEEESEVKRWKGYLNKEEALQEKQKDTYDQVAAVIDYDRSKKGTDDATYDSEHGKKKQAKKERDYAKWQRDKGAEDAQKSGHPWEHAKGSTREKEGKKSEKHAHIKDDKDWGYDKKGNSLNPVDIEKKKRKDDGLFGSPNAKKKVKEDYENEPPIKDQTDKQLASVTFDGGGPDGGATITGTGDPREIPTFVTLIKQKLRARGILVSHHVPEGDNIEEARRADKMGIPRKKVTYDKGEETRNPNPDRGATSLHKPAGSSLSGSKAASRARSLGDARRKANRKGANLAYGDREGRLSSFATTKRQSDADLGAQKAATDTGAHKDKKTGYRQDHKYGKRGDMRRPSYNPKHTANK